MTDTLADTQAPVSGPPEDAAVEATATGATSAFTVQLQVELDRMEVPLGRLQALSEGAVLPLEVAEGPIPVRLIVGARQIATGTLVSVGPGYGVLVSGTE
ncbi:FliM/FliN family flagellar motor switch protein [Novosphingobium gossypii]|uniref:FliM/FliN family flagellar motor switch protein n=1 Tax=Novosphingobium gossypii TaxID=1604774 RepID=UPI003D24F4F7